MKKSISLFFILTVAISGCGIYAVTQSDSKPTADQISRADFGDPPANYKEQIQSYFNSNLMDPGGLIIEYGAPYKSWAQLPKEPNAKLPATHGFKNVYGWSVCGYINAQNRFRGYTGSNMFWTFFRDGVLLNAIYGTPAWTSCQGNEPKL